MVRAGHARRAGAPVLHPSARLSGRSRPLASRRIRPHGQPVATDGRRVVTDWTYSDAMARRLIDKPALVPSDDPLWARILGDDASANRLTRAWASGHLDLIQRWHVDRAIGALPTTFTHADDAIEIEVAGIVVGRLPVDELLG